VGDGLDAKSKMGPLAGNAPRVIADLRTPPIYNVDAVIIKNVRLGGAQTAQIKIEMLNMLNRVQLRSLNGRNTVGNSNFGQTAVQAGAWQLTDADVDEIDRIAPMT
jgi:hypothetical protein